MTAWTLTGSGGLELFGDTHHPPRGADPRACVVLLHGFLGYKDYGFLPPLAARLAARGSVVHRFNFAHSGMTNDHETFARPDLFALQTWNAQVYDTLCVLAAIRGGRISGAGLPLVLAGHSRGGATALLTAGRHPGRLGLDAVVTLAAPDTCCSLDEPAQRAWLASGVHDVRSNRTGQALTILSRWLEDQIADPAGHDLLARAGDVRVPVVAIHGDADPSVPPASASRIAAAAAGGRAVLVPGTNHIFELPNPPVRGGPETPGFVAMADAVQAIVGEVADNQS
jgi:pimeloyl-ACP methyl ester carboxylesterase